MQPFIIMYHSHHHNHHHHHHNHHHHHHHHHININTSCRNRLYALVYRHAAMPPCHRAASQPPCRRALPASHQPPASPRPRQPSPAACHPAALPPCPSAPSTPLLLAPPGGGSVSCVSCAVAAKSPKIGSGTRESGAAHFTREFTVFFFGRFVSEK